jgi:hypothetical protein
MVQLRTVSPAVTESLVKGRRGTSGPAPVRAQQVLRRVESAITFSELITEAEEAVDDEVEHTMW